MLFICCTGGSSCWTWMGSCWTTRQTGPSVLLVLVQYAPASFLMAAWCWMRLWNVGKSSQYCMIQWLTCGVTNPQSCWQTISNIRVVFADKFEWLFRRLFPSMVEWRHLVGNWRRASGGDWNRSQQKSLEWRWTRKYKTHVWIPYDPLVRLEPFQDDTQMSLVQYYQIHVLQMANTHPFPSCVGPSVVKCLFFWTGRHETVCHEIRNLQTSRNSAASPSEFPKAINTRVSMQIASGRNKQLHDNIVQLIWALPAKLITK